MANESFVKNIVNGNEDEENEEDLSKLKVPELKARLKEYGAPVKGKKAELIERLKAVLTAAKTIDNASDQSVAHMEQPELDCVEASSIIATDAEDFASSASADSQIAKLSIWKAVA